jgi:uncharacterized membrane protein YfcA
MFLILGIGFAIGLVLGLLGGGGSILTVPALVYVAGQAPQVAVTASLVIVGANSLAGALMNRQALNWHVALIFGGAGMGMAYVFAGISKHLAPTLLLVLFALLMLGVGMVMLFKRETQARTEPRHWSVVLSAGAVVGALTGLLGVGGGFLIVPALVMLVGMPMSQAVGTSLVIITMNSVAGLLGHIGVMLDWGLVALFIGMGLLGTYAGTRLTRHIPNQQLQKIFASFVVIMALGLLMDNVGKLL